MEQFNENRAVGQLSEILALESGYDRSKARQIRNAAVLHDVGKEKIPESILNKPGKLNEQEFEIIKTHTKLGVELLASLQGDLGDMARIICLFHHEWHEPSMGGYWGISTHYLPDFISFVSISDVFTSLVSERVYKKSWPPEMAVEYLENQADRQFRRELVQLFLSLVRDDSRIKAIFGGREG